MKIIKAFFIIICMTGCSNKSENSYKLNFEVEVYENRAAADIKNVYPIKIKIHNDSNLLFDFWLMSCSFEDSFVFSDDVIQLCNQDCDKNIPRLVNLKKNGEYVLCGKVEIKDMNKLKEKSNLKLGFILIKGSNYNMSAKPFRPLNYYIFNMKKDNVYIWYDVSLKFR